MLLFAANDLSLTALVPRLFLSMAVVIGVMWIAARVMRNRQVSGGGIIRKTASQKAVPTVQVVAKQGLSKNASITVIRVGDKELVLGVTDSNISLLAETASVDLGFPNTGARYDDESRMQSEIQGTGTPRKTSVSATSAAVVSSSTRKGLLEQVREMTVRK
jgi:flagellar biogenesis protein FliO